MMSAPFDLTFADATPPQFAEALAANSFVILRGAIPVRRLSWFLDAAITPTAELWRARGPEIADQAMVEMARYPGVPGISRDAASCLSMARDGCLSDRMIRHATEDRHSLYDLIAEPRLWSLLSAAANGAPLESSIQAHTRSIHPHGFGMQSNGVQWSHRTNMHYDYYFHKELRFCLNVWCPFAAVGTSTAPTLRVLRHPLREVIAWLYPDEKPMAIDAPEFTPEARFGADSFMPLELGLGDVAVLTNWTIHQTHIAPSMTHGRTSAEIRIVAGERAFEAARHVTEPVRPTTARAWYHRVASRALATLSSARR